MFDKIVPAVKSLTERLIVDEPFAEPQPYMGCVIDNGTADLLSESFVALMSRGGSPIMHMKRRDEKLPFLSPAILDATEIHDRPDIELFGPLLQVIRVPDFDAAIVEANNTRYGLRPRSSAASPPISSISGARSAPASSMEPAHQRCLVGGAVRRRSRPVGQPSPGRVLRRRLLRLSGRQQRDGAAPCEPRRGPREG